MIVRITKSWQTSSNELVFELRLSTHGDEPPLPKKAFLTLSPSRAKAPYVSVQVNKPTSMSHKGVGTQLVRKFMAPGTIKSFRQDSEQKSALLVIGSGGKLWQLVRHPSRPPEILLMEGGQKVLGTLTAKSQFTKRYELSAELLAEFSKLEETPFAKLTETLKIPDDPAIAPANLDDDSVDPELSLIRSKIRTRLKRRLKMLKKAYEKTLQGLPSQEDIDDAGSEGTLLSANLHQVVHGSDSIKLIDYNGEERQIKLDPELSPGKNLELKYKLIKKMKGRLLHGGKQKTLTETNLEKTTNQLESLDTTPLGALHQMAKELGIVLSTPQAPKTESKNEQRQPFRTVTIGNGVTALVAKGAKDGDELVKSAKANDFWFHVAGSEGAHIIVPYRNIKSPRPDADIVKNACILAVQNSKLKDDFSGEVYFSQKRHLRKPKGFKPGLWSVERSETLFIKFSQTDLDALFADRK